MTCQNNFCIFIISLISLLAFCSNATSQDWTPIRELSLGRAISDQSDACSNKDSIYVVWSDNRTGNYEIFFRYSNDAGRTWSREEKLTNTSQHSVHPAIACNDQDVHIVWQELDETSSVICYMKWDGRSWTKPLIVSEPLPNSAFSRLPDISVTSSSLPAYVYIVWEVLEQIKEERTRAYIVRSKDNGISFSEPKPLVDGPWSSKDPSIWCGAREAFVTWSDNREGNWHIFLKRLEDVQVGQETKISLYADSSFPTISGWGQQLYIAWQCKKEDKFYNDIYLTHSDNYGMEWNTPVRITDNAADNVHPVISIEDGTPWLFWQSGRNKTWQIWSLSPDYWSTTNELSTSEIGKFTQPVTPEQKHALSPCATSTYRQTHLFWSSISSSSSMTILYTKRDRLPPKQPSPPRHFDLTANLGFDDDDEITFLWEPSEPDEIARYKIYASVNGGEYTYVGDTEKGTYTISAKPGNSYQIYVEALDLAGNVSTPSLPSQKILSDPDPPEVIIHCPNTGTLVRGNIPIIVSVNDLNLSQWVLEYGFTMFPEQWELLAGPFYEMADHKHVSDWETSGLNGVYIVRLSAIDKAGNKNIRTTIVNIDSEPPEMITFKGAKRLTSMSLQYVYGSPSWSRDGNFIAFHSNEGGTLDIWVMELNTSKKLRLTADNNVEMNPTWHPNGAWIAYQSLLMDNQGLSNWSIWIARSDGSIKKQITSGEGQDMNPSWSPDGSILAFDSQTGGFRHIWLVTNMNEVLSGGKPNFVKLTGGDWDDTNPTWSPDSSKLAFQSNRKGNWDIFEIGINGSNIASIVDSPYNELKPRWSPDGKWILYLSDVGKVNYEILGVSWPNKEYRFGLPDIGKGVQSANWSPDMKKMILESDGTLFISELMVPPAELEANISYPRSGQVVSGKVEIFGSASGSLFKDYCLYYLDPTTSALKKIGTESTSKVNEVGFLGSWFTQDLEGTYTLKLIVRGQNDRTVEYSVQVIVNNRLPFLLLNYPPDNLITDRETIEVSGRAESRSVVFVNNLPVNVQSDGSFSQKIHLSDGRNKIVVKAVDMTNDEYIVERNVILDRSLPQVNIETPEDFQVIKTPYVTVKGKVTKQAEVSIQSKRVWTDSNGNFSHTISLEEGMNIITISVSDLLGRYNSTIRRVIYEKAFLKDEFPPAVTDVFPTNDAVLISRSFEISANLVDNVGIDPSTIMFILDGEEIGPDEYELDIGPVSPEQKIEADQYPKVRLTYRPRLFLSDGTHSFAIKFSDTSGNTCDSNFRFYLDTLPCKVWVSASLVESPNVMKITLKSNKTIESIKSVSIVFPDGSGYSISSFSEKGGYYESHISMSMSQRSFMIKAVVSTSASKELAVTGYMAWDTVRAGSFVNIGVENGPRFESDTPLNSTSRISLRSFDGIDTEIENLFSDDVKMRNLIPTEHIYLLECIGDQDKINGIISLPLTDIQEPLRDKINIYLWDNDNRSWIPLKRIRSSETKALSRVNRFGIYALFGDDEPPMIYEVYPPDGVEIAQDRHFISAKVSDRGSGVDFIEMFIDEKRVNFDYNVESGTLQYFLSDLTSGLHRLKISAVDRAGNSNQVLTSFIYQETFKFLFVKIFPNPASEIANIDFRITRSANLILKIYDLDGNLIYRADKENIASGRFEWRLNNASGRKVSSGMYIYILEAGIFDTKIRKHGKIAICR